LNTSRRNNRGSSSPRRSSNRSIFSPSPSPSPSPRRNQNNRTRKNSVTVTNPAYQGPSKL